MVENGTKHVGWCRSCVWTTGRLGTRPSVLSLQNCHYESKPDQNTSDMIDSFFFEESAGEPPTCFFLYFIKMGKENNSYSKNRKYKANNAQEKKESTC
jgi:hypothetical protein